MSYWERNTLILLTGSLIGATFYFGFVIFQSVEAGIVIMPNLWVWVGYIIVQLMFSIGGTWLLNRELVKDIQDLPGGQDERDRLIRRQSESWQGHIMSALIFACLALWFVHQSPALLFHSIIAALILSEVGRGLIQWSKYNRAI